MVETIRYIWSTYGVGQTIYIYIMIYEEYLKKHKKKMDIYYYINVRGLDIRIILYYSPVTIIANKTRRRIGYFIMHIYDAIAHVFVSVHMYTVGVRARRPKRSVSERLTLHRDSGRGPYTRRTNGLITNVVDRYEMTCKRFVRRCMREYKIIIIIYE